MSKKTNDDLRPYPKYKDSGVPWLGDVPEGWEIHRGKCLFTKMERPVSSTDEVITCFRDGTVTLRKNRRIRGFTESIKEIGYQGIKKGDLVIHQMDAFAGAVGVSDSDGKGTPVYSVCLPKRDLNTHYYSFLIREMARSEYILSLAKGIRERSTDFRFSTFASLSLPVPKHEEQTQIARFLDWKTSQINRFIRNKRRLIELLREQKQNIINQAVTRGLDPHVKLKPSGVDWLGDVPQHWEVKRIKNEFYCLNNNRVPLSSTERGTMTIRKYDYYGASGIIDKVDEYIFDDELLLIAEDGANLVLRNLPLAIIARGKYWVNNHAHILKPKMSNLEFLAYSLEQIDYRPWITGAAQPKLTKDRLMSICFAIPDRDEQNRIVEYIIEKTSTLSHTITRTEREIELIREYRARLISDAVTGKIDVCGITVPERDETDLTLLDDETDIDNDLNDEEEPSDETD